MLHTKKLLPNLPKTWKLSSIKLICKYTDAPGSVPKRKTGSGRLKTVFNARTVMTVWYRSG